MSGHGGQTAEPTPVTPSPPLKMPLVPSAAKKLRNPARDGFGSVGKRVLMKSNHFLFGIGSKDPHQYDVTIAPEVTSKTKSRDIMKFLSDSYGASHLGNLLLAYDGKKSAFAAGPLPFDSKEFVVNLTEQNGREREFKVTIKFAARKELDHLRQFLAGRQQDNPQETIQALDVFLRESASKDPEIVGRSLSHTDFGTGPLGDGIEYWKGFYQSLRPTQMGLSLNIDMSARNFYEPKLLSEFVGEFLQREMSRPLSDQERIKVKRALKGVRVEVHRQNYKRRYKVQGLTAQPISQLNFIDETGATKTVVQYFREKYNVQLRFPALLAVQAGTDAKPTYLPMEICWVVPGQRYALKLNERQVTQFIRATCQRPKVREDSIDNAMKHNKYNKDPLVRKDFEMNVTELLTSIEARVLPPLPLHYHESGRSSEVHPSVGVWNMIDLKVINGGTVNFWAVINFSRQNEQAVGRFVNGLVSMYQTKGIVFNPQPLIKMMHAAPHNIEKALVDLQSQCSTQLVKSAPGHHLQMLFIILPEAKGTYPRIKRVCETELGIVSQCCKPQHIMKMSNQYFENVALEINVKVGRRNTVFSATLNGRLPYVTDRPTIILIFGADVTHPQPREDSSPSIAAVVASMDWPQVTKYKALVSAQSHRQEIINDLYTTSTDPKRGIIHGGLMRELLISFKKSTGHKPHRIIFYRDGVSEGQFSEVVASMDDRVPSWWFFSGGAKRRLDTEDEPSTSKRRREIVGKDLYTGSVPKLAPKLIPRTIRGTLLERIHNCNFIHSPVHGDGTCQYRSLSMVLYHTEEKFQVVKKAIIDEMRKNQSLYRAYGRSMHFLGMDTLGSYLHYLKDLDQPYAWGNIMTLFAAANVFRVRVTLVCSISNEKALVMEEVVPAHLVHTHDVYLSYINYTDNDAHYDALFRRDDIPPNPERYIVRDRFEIIVKNLPFSVTTIDLRDIFDGYGNIRSTRVQKSDYGAIGFVEMAEGTDMERAVAGLNGRSLPGPGGILCELEVRVVKVNRFDLQAEADEAARRR